MFGFREKIKSSTCSFASDQPWQPGYTQTNHLVGFPPKDDDTKVLIMLKVSGVERKRAYSQIE